MAAQPSVYLQLPPWEILKFPPDALPPTVPPPVPDGTIRAPFTINPWVFNFVLHPIVPFTFAAVYTWVVLYVNAYNRRNGNKPWWIARQKAFHYFVVAHNISLAVYSLATFLALLRAISVSLPALNDPTGAAGVADALCKLHGPRVLGDAVTFNTTINIWETKTNWVKLTGAGNPDPTDVGRLWNEGLAFWGWLFYISKFYEVVDTLIIVAKGKRSPTLQTYHHAGAMLCLWAGIRYMSPPIWMFVFVNSFIHSVMYCYYTLSALDIKVPEAAKRTLTTMQIAQLLWGSFYAGSQLFWAYDIPVATPYRVLAKVAAVASSASSAYSSASSVVSSAIQSPTISGSVGLFVKKLLLRAAGEEGAAERLGAPAVTDKPVAEVIGSKLGEVKERVFHQPAYETKYRTDYTRVNCIDTSGEAFAIWLNLLYLFPLTVLFARFFIRAYLRRGNRPQNLKQAVDEVKTDAKIAETETEEAVERAGKRAEDVVADGTDELKKEVKTLHEQLQEDVRKLKKGEYSSPKLNERVQKFDKQVKEMVEKAKQQIDQMQQSTTSVGSKDDDDDSDAHDGEDKENQSPSTSGQAPHTPEKKKKRKHKKKHGSSTPHESEAKQDANLAASEPTRPGATDSIDSDAMGRSGVGVDLTKSVTSAKS